MKLGLSRVLYSFYLLHLLGGVLSSRRLRGGRSISIAKSSGSKKATDTSRRTRRMQRKIARSCKRKELPGKGCKKGVHSTNASKRVTRSCKSRELPRKSCMKPARSADASGEWESIRELRSADKKRKAAGAKKPKGKRVRFVRRERVRIISSGTESG